ncbi:hypothetical protein [Phenylobacterium sp.]|uniref:hypothetical protein n=1 Tax=Phenylobacterium sp. TaxID=1871053 RepID=UPI0035B3E83F
MPEAMTFHFEGSLADKHRMNFYESARFQYAAARLMVKLAQFRKSGRFVKKITNNSNIDIQLVTHSDGSFNVNVEDDSNLDDNAFLNVPLGDLLSYVTERIIEKIDENSIAQTISPAAHVVTADGSGATAIAALDQLVDATMLDSSFISRLPTNVQELVKRRIAEIFRERRLAESEAAISKIDFARGQKLIAMSAPLISEMATALRRSADTLEITSSIGERRQSVLFLDQKMAQEIETAIVDEDLSSILGDITQFNKDNGCGKLKIENGTKTLSFSIPSDLLPVIRQQLIDNMKRDMVNLKAYFVRDRSGEPIRVIAVGILETPID